MHDRFLGGNTIDAYVEKTAEARAKDENKRRPVDVPEIHKGRLQDTGCGMQDAEKEIYKIMDNKIIYFRGSIKPISSS